MRDVTVIGIILLVVCLVQIQGNVLGKRVNDNQLEEEPGNDHYNNHGIVRRYVKVTNKINDKALGEIADILHKINMMDGTFMDKRRGRQAADVHKNYNIWKRDSKTQDETVQVEKQQDDAMVQHKYQRQIRKRREQRKKRKDSGK